MEVCKHKFHTCRSKIKILFYSFLSGSVLHPWGLHSAKDGDNVPWQFKLSQVRHCEAR